MQYYTVSQIAEKWQVSERSVRNYCAGGRIKGAFLTGKTWNIPEDAQKPARVNRKQDAPKTLPDILQREKSKSIPAASITKPRSS